MYPHPSAVMVSMGDAYLRAVAVVFVAVLVVMAVMGFGRRR